ncbi:hypothetical protein ACFL6X_01045 [Candidatus Latescibacterota bacterium]
MKDAFLDIAQRMLRLPTAPYCEGFVVAEAVALGIENGLEVEQDEHGNLLLHHNRGSAGRPLIVTAHMDHPGLVYADHLSGRDLLFECAGGVPVELTRDAPVRIYDPGAAADQPGLRGRICAFHGTDSAPVQARDLGSSAFAVRVEGADSEAVAAGCFAMLDLPVLAIGERRLRGRACDDLAGCAVGLTWLAMASTREVSSPCGLLLTRAEEIGFGGMLAAVRSGRLDREALYVNVECSSELAGAPLGEGPIIRVGDRSWIFDAEITAGLTAAADELGGVETGGGEPPFQYQRRLMDGGRCEATALARAGYAAGAAAIPLRNYHNRGRRQLQAEAVDVDDAVGLVRLLLHVAETSGDVSGALGRAIQQIDDSLDQRYEQSHRRLVETRPALDAQAGHSTEVAG